MLDQPVRAGGRPDVDREALHVRRPVGGQHPAVGLVRVAVPVERVGDQPLLLLDGAAARGERELDAVGGGRLLRRAEPFREQRVEGVDRRVGVR
nr:hypothetical protein [Cellulomonas hominis]